MLFKNPKSGNDFMCCDPPCHVEFTAMKFPLLMVRYSNVNFT